MLCHGKFIYSNLNLTIFGHKKEYEWGRRSNIRKKLHTKLHFIFFVIGRLHFACKYKLWSKNRHDWYQLHYLFHILLWLMETIFSNFDVLLTVHLSIFISVFNQLDAQNLFCNKFISCLYMFRAHVFETCRGMK